MALTGILPIPRSHMPFAGHQNGARSPAPKRRRPLIGLTSPGECDPEVLCVRGVALRRKGVPCSSRGADVNRVPRHDASPYLASAWSAHDRPPLPSRSERRSGNNEDAPETTHHRTAIVGLTPQRHRNGQRCEQPTQGLVARTCTHLDACASRYGKSCRKITTMNN